MHAPPGFYSFQPPAVTVAAIAAAAVVAPLRGEGSARGAHCENGVISRCGSVYCWEGNNTINQENARTR